MDDMGMSMAVLSMSVAFALSLQVIVYMAFTLRVA